MNIKNIRIFALITVLALLVTGCGTGSAPTAAPAEAQPAAPAEAQPAAPADTPVSPTSTAEPIAEPSPVPTEAPAPVFDRALLLSAPNLPAFSRSNSELRKGVGTEDQNTDSTRSIMQEIDRDHAFVHSIVDAAGIDSDGAQFTNQLVLYTTEPGLLTEIVGTAKLYFSNELSAAYKTNNLENPTTSVVAAMESINATMTAENPFSWVSAPTFVGREVQNDIACDHYTFDQASLDAAALPLGMTLTSAGGDLCLAVDGGYLVHGQGKIEGQNLHPSPTSAEAALKSGSIEFTQDVKALQPGFSTGTVPELITQVSAPAVYGVPADYRLALTQLDSGESYMYISDQPIEAITAHIKTEMPAQGWSLISAEESAGVYTYKLGKDNLNITVTVVDGVTIPGVKMITYAKSP